MSENSHIITRYRIEFQREYQDVKGRDISGLQPPPMALLRATYDPLCAPVTLPSLNESLSFCPACPPIRILQCMLLRFSTVCCPFELSSVLGTDVFHTLMVLHRDGFVTVLLSNTELQCGVVRMSQLGIDSLGYHHVVSVDSFGVSVRGMEEALQMWRSALQRTVWDVDGCAGEEDFDRRVDAETRQEACLELDTQLAEGKYSEWRWRQSIV